MRQHPNKEVAQFGYAEATEKLETILSQLQAADTPIDKAIELHKEATKIYKELEAYLANAQNLVTRMTEK